MATRALNFKMEEAEIQDMKDVASVFHMTLTELIKEATRDYVDRLKKDPFYRLTANVQEASAEESAEILEEIEGLADDDLSIASSERFAV
jgi:hypothetical protein